MPNEMNPNLDRTPLFTLNGQITIHFMDGQTLEGVFATQDTFNVFLTVGNEPLMIPRNQIKFIRGRAGQSIEPDTSQRNFGQAPIDADTLKSLQSVSEPDEAIFDTDVSVLRHGDLVDEADELTVFLDEVEEDTTVFLETEDDLDATVFFEEDDDDEEDTTLLVAKKEEAAVSIITAYFDCIGGPHAGQRFQLQPGVTTLGRSSDNIFALPNDKEISRRHALITHQSNGTFSIEDRGSLNGVVINDIRIEGGHILKEGENILIGVSVFIFHEK
ncbi:MAG TPA: FHA domain-containing protein [Anaerolineae bacterium]